MLEIISAQSTAHIAEIRTLFREYADSLGFDLSYQNFDQELEDLPGMYAAPTGALLLALVEENFAGCVALRQFDATSCEMKRLYVREQWRGLHVGRKLAAAIVEEGRRLGYQRMLLDTLETMPAAIALYRSLGFQTIDPYYYNPLPRAMFFALQLQ